MSDSPPISKLSIPRVLLVAFIALIAFELLLIFPLGIIGNSLHLAKFDYWYYNGLGPLAISSLATLTSRLTVRGNHAGSWIAGGAVLLVFGGMYLLFRDIDPTDRPIQSVEFMVAGVALGIFILYVWNSRSRNH